MTSAVCPAARMRPEELEAVAVGEVHVEQDQVDRAGRRGPAAPPARCAAVAATSNPCTRPTYAACASAATGSSSTTSTRSGGRVTGGPVAGRLGQAHGEPGAAGGPDRPRRCRRAGDRPGRPAPGRAPAAGAAAAPWWTSRAGTPAGPRPAAAPDRCRSTVSTRTPSLRRVDASTRRSPPSGATRVEGVVDEVADDGDQVARAGGRRRAADRAVDDRSSMPRSAASAVLPSSSAASTGSPTAPTTRSVSSWATCELLGGEVHRLLGAAHLDQGDHRVQPVGGLVVLRAQRLGQAADHVELAGDRLQLGVVAQGDHGADSRPSHRARALADHQHRAAGDVESSAAGRPSASGRDQRRRQAQLGDRAGPTTSSGRSSSRRPRR